MNIWTLAGWCLAVMLLALFVRWRLQVRARVSRRLAISMAGSPIGWVRSVRFACQRDGVPYYLQIEIDMVWLGPLGSSTTAQLDPVFASFSWNGMNAVSHGPEMPRVEMNRVKLYSSAERTINAGRIERRTLVARIEPATYEFFLAEAIVEAIRKRSERVAVAVSVVGVKLDSSGVAAEFEGV